MARLAPSKGWRWPSLNTVRRRFDALPEFEKLAIRRGVAEAKKRFRLYMHRTTAGMAAGNDLSMDGRELDIWVGDGDGPYLPTLIVFVCIRTQKVTAWHFAKSETAEAARALILKHCERWGKPDRIHTDNVLCRQEHGERGREISSRRSVPARLSA
ncbi:MAG: hypothetical protein R6V44_05265 [Paracoccaceae bacterium]